MCSGSKFLICTWFEFIEAHGHLNNYNTSTNVFYLSSLSAEYEITVGCFEHFGQWQVATHNTTVQLMSDHFQNSFYLVLMSKHFSVLISYSAEPALGCIQPHYTYQWPVSLINVHNGSLISSVPGIKVDGRGAQDRINY